MLAVPVRSESTGTNLKDSIDEIDLDRIGTRYVPVLELDVTWACQQC